MNVGSLFSGVGGIDLGLERAGMRVLWQVENDEQCQTVLRHRFTGTELYDDVKEVYGLRVENGGEGEDNADHRSNATDWNEHGRGAKNSGISRHDGNEPRPDLAPVDLICGGFPCTDLSVAGKRAGRTGAGRNRAIRVTHWQQERIHR